MLGSIYGTLKNAHKHGGCGGYFSFVKLALLFAGSIEMPSAAARSRHLLDRP